MPVTPNTSDPNPTVALLSPLLTVDEYQTFMGLDSIEPEDTAQIEALIPVASRVIRAYTGRRFDSTGAATARSFRFEGDPYLATDDFTELVSVEADTGVGGYTRTLDVLEYTPLPTRETTDDDPYSFILLHTFPYGFSAEMGFTRNLDQYEFSGRSPLITVTAVWGWASIPDEVKMAAALIIRAIIENPGPYTTEAIESYSRSQRLPTGDVIPDRAKTLLAPFIQMNV